MVDQLGSGSLWGSCSMDQYRTEYRCRGKVHTWLEGVDHVPRCASTWRGGARLGPSFVGDSGKALLRTRQHSWTDLDWCLSPSRSRGPLRPLLSVGTDPNPPRNRRYLPRWARRRLARALRRCNGAPTRTTGAPYHDPPGVGYVPELRERRPGPHVQHRCSDRGCLGNEAPPVPRSRRQHGRTVQPPPMETLKEHRWVRRWSGGGVGLGRVIEPM